MIIKNIKSRQKHDSQGEDVREVMEEEVDDINPDVTENEKK